MGASSLKGYNVIACDIIANKKNGYERLPILMLAKDGKIIEDNTDNVTITRQYTVIHPETNKIMDNHLIYNCSIDSNEAYKVEFIREEDIITVNLLSSLNRLLARIGKARNINPTYSRIQ